MGVTQQAIVVGGGITGLSCAFRLKQAGIRVLLLEAADSAGGLIATVEKKGFLFEAGPQCPRFPLALWELIREIGLENQVVRGDSRAPRYILKKGRLHTAPLSPLAFVSTSLVGAASKYRLLTEAFRRSKPPRDEESLAAFVRRKFDGDVLAYLVDPFIAAIFGGDSEKIGIDSAFPFLARWERGYGSVLAGAIRARKTGARPGSQDSPSQGNGPTKTDSYVVTESLPSMGSFRTGLGALPEKLTETLGDSIRLRAKVQSIDAVETAGKPGRTWRLRLVNGEEMNAAALVVAAPAYEAARLLQKPVSELSAMLSEISYAPMAVISSGYDRARVRNPLRGFGLMIPPCEKLNTIFNVWNSSVFHGRAPEGSVLMTSFAGGAGNPAFVKEDEGTIARIVEREMGAVLGIDGSPVERSVWKHTKALPQFNIGHAQTVSAIRGSLGKLPGLYLAGNYLGGRSLGDCVESGSQAADEICLQFSKYPRDGEDSAAIV